MKNIKWVLILLLLVATTLTLAACGEEATPEPAEPEPTEVVQVPEDTPVPPTDTPVPPTDTPVPPTDTPIPEPTDTPIPEPTAEPEPEEELDPSALSSLADLTSYRQHMYISMEGTSAGEDTSAEMELLIEYTSEPPAQHFVIAAVGIEGAEEFGDLEMYVIGETMYIRLGADWMSAPADTDLISDFDMGSGEELLEDTCGWKKQADTEVNGIAVHHYSISLEDVEACAPAEELADLGDVTDLSGDLYIAVDGNYMVKMDLVYEGSNLDVGLGTLAGDEEAGVDEGRIQITVELSDVNVPFTIELPEEATAGAGLPEDIPAPADAQDVSSMMGMIVFTSAGTPQEVSDFYRAEMPNNGWTETSVDEMGDMFMHEYTKDGRTANLVISVDQNTGRTSVLITLTE